MKNFMKYIIKTFVTFLMAVTIITAQEKKENPPPMKIDVGRFNLTMNRLMGDGGLQSQFSWNLTGDNRQNTEIFYWPQDRWQSNMLYQIFNPVVLDENGIIDEFGVKKNMMLRGDALTNFGVNDWAYEVRRYRPPLIVVDGIPLNPPYQWYVDPTLNTDIKIVFEDVLPQFGIRSRVEMFAFSNPEHSDYFIWKATHKFTGEIKIPRNAALSTDTIPDQTIRIWWPLSFSFGPSKAGERYVTNNFSYEGEDDLDSWFARTSELVPDRERDSLYVAYYYDAVTSGTQAYSNGSRDDTGDPDRNTGFLHSTQIPGFTLLHADKSYSEKTDDPTQPYSMPHAGILRDLWGRRDINLKLTYRGDDERGKFPLESATPEKGPMRFITNGPYDLTKNSQTGRYDSVTFVYAVGTGSIDFQTADSIGKAWLNNQISSEEKKEWVLRGIEPLFQTLDLANWAYNEISNGRSVASAPPSPDITVTSGPDMINVEWNYPDEDYFKDAVTGVDDWAEWRVYRKEGALLVNDPSDMGTGKQWRQIFSTTDRNIQSFQDENVIRGIDYYYAVTAVDNGTFNNSPVTPGQPLESSRYITRSLLPAVSVKPGLNTSGQVRVVPNPATVATGTALQAGDPSNSKISFFNLPVKCTLRIFTETGNLVRTIEHYGTADEEWFQLTDSNQYVTSGIYILAVTDSEDIDGNKLEDQFVKFVIVR
jgi:hypothetical protein